MKRIVNITIFLMALLISGCEKFFIKDDPENNPENVFDFAWKTLDEKYSFFQFKGIDWDSIYNVYKPQVYDQMPDTALFQLLGKMLFTLRDGHITLTDPQRGILFYQWYDPDATNYKASIIRKHYLQDNFNRDGALIYKKLDDVGYIHYLSNNEMVTVQDMKRIIASFGDVKGIILDIRNNPGGEVLSARNIASAFNPSPRLASYWLFKSGPGRDNFSSPSPFYLTSSGSEVFSKKIAVLTNKVSYSATNDLALMLKSLPNAFLIGDSTGGGGGIPMHTDLPNGWVMSYSTTQTLAPDGTNVEDGIAPDFYVLFTSEDTLKMIDPIIERAFQEIRK
jgi:hypothetical protein